MIVISWASVKSYLAPLSKDPLVDEKAAKALLVLIPLLGTTYVLVIVTPSHRTARVIFSYLQAVLLSTQRIYCCHSLLLSERRSKFLIFLNGVQLFTACWLPKDSNLKDGGNKIHT
ncbi:hypothetical protein CEXT_307841 [Caerostris extrusa]|uniref:Uncharacterized protein n=1 Tax=Caerostris extrusa TaxID=172846 RepID=A0AAV4XER8_CAEEX|nr:hypothetical protein CEXT_307841 [Caerostris extrusa]